MKISTIPLCDECLLCNEEHYKYDWSYLTLFLSLPQSEAGVKEFHIVQVSSNSKHWKLQKSVNISEDKGVYP